MYIQPGTDITLYSGIPLDPTFEHTCYFSTNNARDAWFQPQQSHVFHNQTYQRVDKGWLQVEGSADSLYNSNYLSFRNASFGNKLFYAFITGFEYINNETTRIYYSVDPFMTWCETRVSGYIEREMDATDRLGRNTIPEGVELGEYIVNKTDHIDRLDDLRICVAATVDSAGGDATGDMYGGVYSGLAYSFFDRKDQVNNFIAKLVDENKANSIVAIFMCPRAADTREIIEPSRFNIERVPPFEGYLPRNYKLYCYPYNYLNVINNQGSNAVYRYELFNYDHEFGNPPDTLQFEYGGVVTCNPEIIVRPVGYGGIGNDGYSSRLSLTGYPQCPYTTDTFKMWLAQNSTQLAVQGLTMAGDVISSGASLVNPLIGDNPVNVGGFVRAARGVARVADLATLPPQARGTQTSGTDIAFGKKNFFFQQTSITAEYASMIDQFFDVYGYQTNRWGVPNVATRPIWNYVKMAEVFVGGNIPAPYREIMINAYKRGITFWYFGRHFGAYNLAEINTARSG